MQFDWQTIVALMIVGWAFFRLFKTVTGSSPSRQTGCGVCRRCPQSTADSPQKIYTLS